MNAQKADVLELKRIYMRGRADQTRLVMTLADVVGIMDRAPARGRA
jgi:hypothetical protein